MFIVVIDNGMYFFHKLQIIFGRKILHSLTVVIFCAFQTKDTDETELFELLPQRSSFILDQFVAHHDVDDLTQHLVWVVSRYYTDTCFSKTKLNLASVGADNSSL